LASTAQAFVPAGFSLEREVSGDLGWADPGVAQVYENAAGRRALLIGVRHPNGFEATGWGFVLPCSTCGADLPADRNLDVSIRQQAVVVVDRSVSKNDDTTTDAELTLRYDTATRQWLLATLTQLTAYPSQQKAEESFVDYLHGKTRDAQGSYDGATFSAQTEQKGEIPIQALSLDTLTLY
jgi:hypothetical protein